MKFLVIFVSKIFFGGGSRTNYSTIANIFKNNVISIMRHINSSVNLYKND